MPENTDWDPIKQNLLETQRIIRENAVDQAKTDAKIEELQAMIEPKYSPEVIAAIAN